MTDPRVVRDAAPIAPALTLQHIDGPLEMCDVAGCTRPGEWAVNYADAAVALPAPERSCGLHLTRTGYLLIGIAC